jgi:hypothetical protein
MAAVADRIHMAAGRAGAHQGSELLDPFTCCRTDLRARTIDDHCDQTRDHARSTFDSTAATGDPTTVGGGACHERSGTVFFLSGEHATAQRYAQTDRDAKRLPPYVCTGIGWIVPSAWLDQWRCGSSGVIVRRSQTGVCVPS